MKRNYFIIAAAGIALLATACKKDIPDMDNTYPGSTGSNGGLANLFAQNAPPMQQFTINASTGGFITGANGATLMISPNAFVYQNNQPVTGNVTVSLQEVYNKRDIIFSGGFTTAYGLPLVSGGEINVTAYQNSQELKLAYSGAIYATIPTTANDPAMNLFRGSNFGPDRDFVLANQNVINPQPDCTWAPGPNNYHYGFGLDSLHWTNCDVYMGLFYGVNDMTEFSVSVPSIFNDTNCYVIITSSHADFACRLYNYDYATSTFECGYYRLPVGLDFTFTIISEINGTYYYDSRTVTLAENTSVALTPAITTEAQIIQNVGNL